LIGCPLFPVSVDTLYLAEELIRKHKFQLFDSFVVAAAVEAGCETLYSDDMHHKLTVNKQLTIVNPFLR
jgi:predicted nucleic acid-binding protein